MDKYQIKDNPAQARDRYETVKKSKFIKDASGEIWLGLSVCVRVIQA